MYQRATTALFSLLVGSAAVADTVDGQQIVMQGNGKGAVACMACHGADGAGNPAAGFPRLAGLDAGYLQKQLADYKNGTRDNPVMNPNAMSLSDQEAAAAAAYYAAQRVNAQAPAAEAADRLALGEKLATRGNWDKNVPACFSCHGPGGQGVGAAFPALAGQHAGYIATQIRDWKGGARHNDPQNLMKVVAERLSDDETAAVAAYLAGLASAK